MNAASVVVTCEVVGTLRCYKMVKKVLNFAYLEVVGHKNYSIICSSLELVLELQLELALAVA